MKTHRDIADMVGFRSVSDALTEAIVGLLADDAQVRRAAEDYIDACMIYQAGAESPAAVNDAERKLRRVIAPKIRGALSKHGEEWDMPDNADDLVDQFVDDGAFVEFYMEA